MVPLAPRPRLLAVVASIAAASGALATAAALRPTPAAAPAPHVVTITIPVPVAIPTPTAAAPPPHEPARTCRADRRFGRAELDLRYGESRDAGPWHWYETVVDCRGQIVQLAATDLARVVVLDRGVPRTIELPELAVPRAIDHWQWDTAIRLVAARDRDLLAVVGHDATDRRRVLARVSTDGGWTWETRDLGTTDRAIAGARVTADGSITWRRGAR